MQNFYIFSNALNYIEDNLCNDFTQEDIANACYCSLSSLQKIWRYCTITSLKEYISKRRLTKAAYDIVHTDDSILDISFKYQYNSPEVFTRAFAKLWGTPPSKFKSKWGFTDLFPKIIANQELYKIGGNIMQRRYIDLSELYDKLKENLGTYILCCDTVGLDTINKNISYQAGDLVILECLRRLDSASEDGMLVFRIGGDEFVVVTGISDTTEVETFADKILSQNGNTVSFENNEIAVSMRIGACRYETRNLRYNELFDSLQNTIDNTRDTGKTVFIQ